MTVEVGYPAGAVALYCIGAVLMVAGFFFGVVFSVCTIGGRLARRLSKYNAWWPASYLICYGVGAFLWLISVVWMSST